MNLSKHLSQAEGAIDQALYAIASEKKLTRREAKAIEVTVAKIQYVSELIGMKAFDLMPCDTMVKRRANAVVKIN